MPIKHKKNYFLQFIICFLSGALLPLAFSPYHYSIIAILSLACLFYIIRNNTPKNAGILGYVFGFGMFGTGINWLHISINLFGGVNLVGALIITFILVAFLSLYPAFFAFAHQHLFVNKKGLHFIITMPMLWVLSEWFRSSIVIDFPWLTIGYSQIDTPISSLAPLIGQHGVSWLTALISTLLVALYPASHKTQFIIVSFLFIIYLGLGVLSTIPWTKNKNADIAVSLVQGAIPQEIKWQPQQRKKTLELYLSLSEEYKKSQLVIWPETAIPMLHSEAQEFMDDIALIAKNKNRDYLVGIPFHDKNLNKTYNGIAVIGNTDNIYHKQHLVPFGEYLPFEKWLRPVLDFMQIPLPDFSPGPNKRPIVHVANEIIGVSICYEIVFSEDIILALPEATILVNISNDAWFGDSMAPHQHLQMARMRALETGRYMLRSTNTGVSAIINEKGAITVRSPQFIPHVIGDTVKTFEGLTPYARFGNSPLIATIFLVLLIVRLKKLH